MADRNTCVVYLLRIDEGREPVETFVNAYAKYVAGIAHHLLVLRRGFETDGSWAQFAALFGEKGIRHDVLDVPVEGYDLGAYQQVVETLNDDYFCFMNTFSEVLSDGWLEHLYRSARLSGVGLAGSTGSYESVYSAEIAGRSWRARLSGGRWRSAIHEYRKVSRLRRQYPAFPNPHVRTNAFLVRRNVAKVLHWGPYRSKDDTRRSESGRHGLSHQAEILGLRNVVVGRDGVVYEVEDWPSSWTFRSGGQSNLLVADNQTRAYEGGTSEERLRLGLLAWGTRYEAFTAESESRAGADRLA
jgi:hypothetical protein